MIVSERNVSDALSYLAIDPHPIALARKDLTDAENDVKETYANAFLEAEGSVAAKEAEATLHRAVIDRKRAEADAILALERHKARMKAAEMLIEVWRSENANVRAAERVR